MRYAVLGLVLVASFGAVGSAAETDPYVLLRREWAASEDYNPLFGMGDGREEILGLFAEGKYEKFMVESEKYLRKVPVDIVMYSLRATACAMADDMRGFMRNNAIAWGLANATCSSGTGKTKDSPFVVVSTNEEYGLLHLMGLEPISQRLVEGKYDVQTVEIGGEKREIWFDVSMQMAYYGKIFTGAKADGKDEARE